MKSIFLNKWTVWLLCFLIMTAFLMRLHSNGYSQTDNEESFENQAEPTTVNESIPSREPHFLSIQMNLPLRALVAGETGSFEIEASLRTPNDNHERIPLWDRNSPTPLNIWISTPQESGIAFIDLPFPSCRIQ